MNLHKLARFVVIIWLPLATLELQSLNDSFSNKTIIASDEREEYLTKNVAVEENSVEMHKSKLMSVLAENDTPGNLSRITSANPLDLKSEESTYSEGKYANAHKLKGSIKKDLSALISSKNASAETSEIPVNNEYNKTKSNIRKRNSAIEISVGEDPHSPDDYEEEEDEDIEVGNSSEIGSFVGAPCELTCNKKLLHVFCDPRNKICECEDMYPVQIGPRIGCEKPKLLGDQCFYAETCSFFDANAVCMQIDHNAICQCKPGFHAVALRKGVKRMFCSEDVAVVSADLSTLLGVATGIAVLTGLICFVLRLFNGNPNAGHYANSRIAPPLLLSNDNQWVNGIPLTIQNRASSRASSHRSTMSLAQPGGRSKGVLVPVSRAGAARAAAILLIPCHLQASRHSEAIGSNNSEDTEAHLNEVERTSRAGSRRQSFSSMHSTTSSQKSMSYSARRFEQENQQREQRLAMRAAREEAARATASFSPSPLSTNGMMMPFSKETEEDPLCDHPQNPPPVSEPPAFSLAHSNTATAPKSSLN